MARKSEGSVTHAVDWDAGIYQIVKDMVAGDAVWLYNSRLVEGPDEVKITAPTLGMAEEIKSRFGGSIAQKYKKNITYNWDEVGARTPCRISHANRLGKLNPHINYPENQCNCYTCKGFK